MKFIINWSKDKSFPNGQTFLNADLDAHVNYIKQSVDSGNVIMAGPYASGEGGMTIYECNDECQVIDFIKNDPDVKTGIIKGSFEQWHVIIGKNRFK